MITIEELLWGNEPEGNDGEHFGEGDGDDTNQLKNGCMLICCIGGSGGTPCLNGDAGCK